MGLRGAEGEVYALMKSMLWSDGETFVAHQRLIWDTDPIWWLAMEITERRVMIFCVAEVAEAHQALGDSVLEAIQAQEAPADMALETHQQLTVFKHYLYLNNV